VGAIIVTVGLVAAVGARIDGLHTARLQIASISSPLASEELQLLKLVNDERQHAGIAPLQFSPRLMTAARTHSLDMATRRYLGHDSPAGDTPTERVRTAGIYYDELAENVFSGDTAHPEDLPREAIEAWMHSPAHRANLLSPGFRLSAVGIACASSGNYYITQDFVR
jgi:uncharacterized protein YkwD